MLRAFSEKTRVIKHNIDFKDWVEDDSFYYRCPNHLNLIKTDIAKQIGYRNVNYAEDFDFSIRLRDKGLLKTESKNPKVTYIYKFNTKK